MVSIPSSNVSLLPSKKHEQCEHNERDERRERRERLHQDSAFVHGCSWTVHGSIEISLLLS